MNASPVYQAHFSVAQPNNTFTTLYLFVKLIFGIKTYAVYIFFLKVGEPIKQNKHRISKDIVFDKSGSFFNEGNWVHG
jgi:hypothetical protein